MSSEEQVLVEVHPEGHTVRAKKQDGLEKGPERSALSSTRCFPAVLILAVRMRWHVMMQSHAFASALSVIVRVEWGWLFESAELRLQRHLRGWHWSFGWRGMLV